MSYSLQHIQHKISPLKDQIVNHKIYTVINDIEDLQIFMQFHVYAVWDFMSLLKSLQRNLTCTTLPWFPVGSGNTRSLINEIVAGEESDIDANGNKKSHFEMYLDAMDQCDADTTEIKVFLAELQKTNSFEAAYAAAHTPVAARNFVDHTFTIINSGKSHLQAGAFTFGREDLIPNMFRTLVNDLNLKFPNQVSLFKYYLDRHIEVDGDHHSHLALAMTEELCHSEEDFISAEQVTLAALEQRIQLWNGAYEAIMLKKQAHVAL